MPSEPTVAKSFSSNTSIIPNVSAGSQAQSQHSSRSVGAPSVAISRDEMNLAEFPLAVLSTRVNSKLKTLEFRDVQRLKNGEVKEREWIITGADKFGLPTATDDDVILALMRLSMNHGFRERKVYFTRYELLKILRWSTEGRSYIRLIKSLDRLSGVRIRATNAFYDNDSKSYQTCNFGIIDSYEINDSRGKKATSPSPKSFFSWSEVLFDSFQAGFIKKLDLELYFRLNSAVSRRLYRYLDKHFYYKSSLEKNLMTMAFEKLGLSRNYKYISSIKQQLEPALEELIEKGFLSHFDYGQQGADTTIRIYAARPIHGQIVEPQAAATTAVPQSQRQQRLPNIAVDQTKNTAVVRTLIARGISSKQARNLLHSKTDAECEQITNIIHYYDFLVARNDRKISRNKVGFLYRAVENPQKFTIPKTFGKQQSNSVIKRRVVNSNLNEEQKHEALSLYRQFVQEKVAFYRRGMTQEQISVMYEGLERKMASLRPVLEKSAFEMALQGCLNDEIAKKAGVPDFNSWFADGARTHK